MDARKLLLLDSASRPLFLATFSWLVAAPLPNPLTVDIGSLAITDTEQRLSIDSVLFQATFGSPASAPLGSPFLVDLGSLAITDTESKLSVV